MSNLKKKLLINDFWSDCLKENNTLNISKNNNKSSPLIYYYNKVKNNKNIKKRINICINDYKEYSEKYSSIEVEIKPVNNKSGRFINIKEEDKKYYHIYFNNNKEEKKNIERNI